MTKRVAVLATNGYEKSELNSPKEAMEKEGFQVDIVSLEKGKIKGWSDANWSGEIDVNYTLSEVTARDYNALLIPGGVINPDKLRTDDKALQFVRDFFRQKKPVAAICHAAWVLISANVVDGRKMTSYPSIKDDLINAGAHWEDTEVVVDQGLVTSRSPKDLDAFNAKIVEEIKEGKHEMQGV
ncbi:type 1 glutamine amidotransferase domain-containing protein [Paucihalobacter sp.]|uniref:type 1 glutamine amidotransferase domain-containing protein n=1 Tax=Paucihalobacter sp. TaxID=2850405 RepID=UPI002FE23CD7